MKRQDVSGVERLAVDSTGGGGSTVDVIGINGVAPSVNNGTADAGTLRVTVASDSTGQIKLAAGAAVIGHVITDTGSTTAVTGNVTVIQGTGTNLHAVLDAGSTTTVTQGTGTNLHTVVDSGTVTASISGTVGVTQSTSPWVVAGGGTAGTAATGVVTVQGIASMTKLLVTPDANASVNVNQLAGTATSVNSGTKDAGTLRVVLATDQPQLTNKLLVTPDALPAGTALIGKVSASNETSTIYSGTTAVTPKFAAISASSNGNNTVVVAGTNKIRVLGWSLMSSGTVNVKWQSGAGGTDLTGLYYLIANTGISVAYSPVGWFETASATLLNLNLSGAVPVGGNLCYIDVA